MHYTEAQLLPFLYHVLFLYLCGTNSIYRKGFSKTSQRDHHTLRTSPVPVSLLFKQEHTAVDTAQSPAILQAQQHFSYVFTFYTNTVLFPRVSNAWFFYSSLSRQLVSVLSETYCPDILAVQFPFVARSSTLSDSRLRSNFSSDQLIGMHKRLRQRPETVKLCLFMQILFGE